MTAEKLPLPPPIARIDHKETALHCAVLTDDYAWLRDKENSEVTAYLEAENAYAEAVMAPLDNLREELYQEMLSHVKQTNVSVPYRDSFVGRAVRGRTPALTVSGAGNHPTQPPAGARDSVSVSPAVITRSWVSMCSAFSELSAASFQRRSAHWPLGRKSSVMLTSRAEVSVMPPRNHWSPERRAITK